VNFCVLVCVCCACVQMDSKAVIPDSAARTQSGGHLSALTESIRLSFECPHEIASLIAHYAVMMVWTVCTVAGRPYGGGRDDPRSSGVVRMFCDGYGDGALFSCVTGCAMADAGRTVIVGDLSNGKLHSRTVDLRSGQVVTRLSLQTLESSFSMAMAMDTHDPARPVLLIARRNDIDVVEWPTDLMTAAPRLVGTWVSGFESVVALTVRRSDGTLLVADNGPAQLFAVPVDHATALAAVQAAKPIGSLIAVRADTRFPGVGDPRLIAGRPRVPGQSVNRDGADGAPTLFSSLGTCH
jgi:hypothetical protein